MADSSLSEVTVYKWAVEQINPEFNPQLNVQIDSYLNHARHESGMNSQMGTIIPSRKDSTSSEEMMDTSDETVEAEVVAINKFFPLLLQMRL